MDELDSLEGKIIANIGKTDLNLVIYFTDGSHLSVYPNICVDYPEDSVLCTSVHGVNNES